MTIVIFRKYKKSGEVFAVFPYELWNQNGDVACYETVGQHGAGDYWTCLNISRPAQPNEYQTLLKELQSIGYDDLIISKRRNHTKWGQAWDRIKNRGAK